MVLLQNNGPRFPFSFLDRQRTPAQQDGGVLRILRYVRGLGGVKSKFFRPLKLRDTPYPTAIQSETWHIYLLSEHDDPTPRFAFRFYVPGLLRWSGVYLGVCLGIVFVLPSGPDISLKTALLVIAAGLFIGVIAWHVRLAYSAVSHWRLLKRILNWGTIHRLCELHDAEVELNHELSK